MSNPAFFAKLSVSQRASSAPPTAIWFAIFAELPRAAGSDPLGAFGVRGHRLFRRRAVLLLASEEDGELPVLRPPSSRR